MVLGNVCLIKSKVNAATHWEILERFMLPSADEPYGDAGFLLWQDFTPARSAKTAIKGFADRVIM